MVDESARLLGHIGMANENGVGLDFTSWGEGGRVYVDPTPDGCLLGIKVQDGESEVEASIDLTEREARKLIGNIVNHARIAEEEREA